MQEAHLTLLRTHLADAYVALLPALLVPSTVAEQNQQKNISRALSAFVLHMICGCTISAACASIVDDFADLGIDAVFYSPENRTLYLVQSKLKASADFTQEEANSFCQGIRKIITCDFTGFNQHITLRQAEIEDALDKCDHIELVVAHLGDALKQYPAQSIAELIADTSHGEERLVNAVRNVNSTEIVAALQGVNAYEQVDCRLPLFDWASISGPRRAYTAFAKLSDLARLHETHGRALYAKNIRASLGHRTNVNIAIAATLATAPADFAFFNNGVTILCRQVRTRGGSRDRKTFEIKGLSIVNGAQTVATAAHYVSTAQAGNIDAARVLVTIIVADGDDTFGQSVTQSRNHQNSVKTADFTALDPEQERLRRELALLGIRYAYQAEAQDLTDPATMRVDEAAAALAMLHPDPRLPIMAKRSATSLQLVDEYPYSTLFTPALTAYQLRNAVDVFRYIMVRMGQEATAAANGSERLAYRHGAFVLAFVLMKRLHTAIDAPARIDPQKLAAVVGPILDSLRQILWDQTTPHLAVRGPLAIFRNQADANIILRLAMTAHYALDADAALPALLALDTSTQPYPERLFNYLASRAPQIGNIT